MIAHLDPGPAHDDVHQVLQLQQMKRFATSSSPQQPRALDFGVEVRPVVHNVHVGMQLPGLHRATVAIAGKLQAFESERAKKSFLSRCIDLSKLHTTIV